MSLLFVAFRRREPDEGFVENFVDSEGGRRDAGEVRSLSRVPSFMEGITSSGAGDKFCFIGLLFKTFDLRDGVMGVRN